MEKILFINLKMTNGAYGTYQMLPTSQHLVDIKAQLEQVTNLVSLCDYKTMSIPFCIGLFVTNEKNRPTRIGSSSYSSGAI